MFNWIKNLIKKNTTLILKQEWEVKPKKKKKTKKKSKKKSKKKKRKGPYDGPWNGRI